VFSTNINDQKWIFFCKVGKFATIKKIEMENKLQEGEDYYLTPEGYRCFTEKYHLKRGYCCKSGCRHCPYGFNKKTSTIQKNIKK
jgi:hypothetical protein